MRFLLTALLLLWQQPQQTSIQGAVVKAGTNDPISGILVELRRADPTPTLVASATTGSDGKFSLQNVPAGSYRLIAQHPSGVYVRTEYLQRNAQAHGAVLEVAGQPLRDLQIGMSSSGSISGRVIDIDGELAANARVMALQAAYRDGQRVLSIVEALRTNDNGEYRLFWLPPGQYFIGVQPVDPRIGGFAEQVVPPGRIVFREDGGTPQVTRRTLENGETVEEVRIVTYFGGGTNPERARQIDLSSGQNVGAIDIPLLDTRVLTYHVRGSVMNAATGLPSPNAIVRLIPKVYAGPFVNIPNATSDARGGYDIGGVTPGSYWLLAVLGGQSFGGRQYGGFTGPGLRLQNGTNALATVDVAGNSIDNLAVTLRTGRSIPIHASVEGGALSLAEVSVTMVRSPDLLGLPSAETGRLTAEGTVTIAGVGPGDYRIDVNGLPPAAFIKSLKMGPSDLETGFHVANETEGTLELVIGANGGTLSGSAINARREPVVNATVVLIPDVPRRGQASLYKVAFSDPSGKFSIRGIAPGGYRIFAWESVEDGAWQNSTFLQTYEPRGSAVRVAEGSSQNLEVTSIPGGERQ